MKEFTIKEAIIHAINNIISRDRSKYADLKDIYVEVAKMLNREQDEALEAQIRARLQEHSSQYTNYLGKEDLFETSEKNSGKWKNKTTGEADLKPLVIKLINQFPGIDVTSLQEILLDTMADKLTEADKLESLTRPGEKKIEQIIRNFVSHQDRYKEEIDFRNEGGKTRLYLKDEQDILEEYINLDNLENLFVAENELPDYDKSETHLTMQQPPRVEKKEKKKSERKYTRKSDVKKYIAEYNTKLENGLVAERLVYEYEKEKLINAGYPEFAKKVRWVSRDDGDGYGYDIISYEIVNNAPKKIYIEVKSTTSGLNSDFEISDSELKFAREHSDEYRLYRIGKTNSKEPIGYVVEIPLDDYFVFEPVSYKASIRKIDKDLS